MAPRRSRKCWRIRDWDAAYAVPPEKAMRYGLLYLRLWLPGTSEGNRWRAQRREMRRAWGSHELEGIALELLMAAAQRDRDHGRFIDPSGLPASLIAIAEDVGTTPRKLRRALEALSRPEIAFLAHDACLPAGTARRPGAAPMEREDGRESPQEAGATPSAPGGGGGGGPPPGAARTSGDRRTDAAGTDKAKAKAEPSRCAAGPLARPAAARQEKTRKEAAFGRTRQEVGKREGGGEAVPTGRQAEPRGEPGARAEPQRQAAETAATEPPADRTNAEGAGTTTPPPGPSDGGAGNAGAAAVGPPPGGATGEADMGEAHHDAADRTDAEGAGHAPSPARSDSEPLWGLPNTRLVYQPRSMGVLIVEMLQIGLLCRTVRERWRQEKAVASRWEQVLAEFDAAGLDVDDVREFAARRIRHARHLGANNGLAEEAARKGDQWIRERYGVEPCSPDAEREITIQARAKIWMYETAEQAAKLARKAREE